MDKYANNELTETSSDNIISDNDLLMEVNKIRNDINQTILNIQSGGVCTENQNDCSPDDISGEPGSVMRKEPKINEHSAHTISGVTSRYSLKTLPENTRVYIATYKNSIDPTNITIDDSGDNNKKPYIFSSNRHLALSALGSCAPGKRMPYVHEFRIRPELGGLNYINEPIIAAGDSDKLYDKYCQPIGDQQVNGFYYNISPKQYERLMGIERGGEFELGLCNTRYLQYITTFACIGSRNIVAIPRE